MSHNLFSSLFVNSFSMFRVSSEAKFLEVELPGSLALSISEVLKALPAAPMGCLHSSVSVGDASPVAPTASCDG